jgi:hypothetical protein
VIEQLFKLGPPKGTIAALSCPETGDDIPQSGGAVVEATSNLVYSIKRMLVTLSLTASASQGDCELPQRSIARSHTDCSPADSVPVILPGQARQNASPNHGRLAGARSAMDEDERFLA